MAAAAGLESYVAATDVGTEVDVDGLGGKHASERHFEDIGRDAEQGVARKDDANGGD